MLRELLERKRAQESLVRFTEATCDWYVTAAHHKAIAEKLEAIERGDIDRLMINLPPRNGKSELASRRFPAWFLGRHPNKSVIAASYNSDLATDFGRQVRNIIASEEYKGIFKTDLAEDSRAANRWNTAEGGGYVAAGVGTAITGRGADVLLIDDPLKDREEADSELQRQKVWDWYTSTAYTRLAPGGRVIVIQCLSGDAMITMADGALKRLDSIEVGDRVLSWNGTNFVGSLVEGLVNNGHDQTYLIKTKKTSVRANARHPFLVLSDEGLRWVRTKDLRSGMRIVAQSAGPIRAGHVLPMDATSLPNVGACATATTTKQNGRLEVGRHQSAVKPGSRTAENGGMELSGKISTDYSQSRAGYARSAEQMAARGDQSIGSLTSAPTITTRQGRFAAYYATIATGSQDELEIPAFWNVPSNTSGPDTDEVVSVTPHGLENVYDLTVGGTHNFVANGLWTHNTRWHEDDLSGRLITEEGRGGDKWEKLILPAINDAGEALWPEFYPIETLERYRRVLPERDWSALYQQRPTPDEGAYFKREWFRHYDAMPTNLRTYGASDYAVTAKGGDYTVHVVAGVDPDDNIYIIDVWRSQAETHHWVDAYIDLIARWKPLMWAQESGQIIKSLGPFIDRRMRERRVYCAQEQMTSVADKPTRARSFQARAAMGKVYLPHNAAWVADLMGELLTFPAGRHDDQVDALGLIGRMVDKMVGGRAPRVEATPTDKWRRAFARRAEADNSSNDWKTA